MIKCTEQSKKIEKSYYLNLGGLFHKTFMSAIDSRAYQAGILVQANKNVTTITKTLTCHALEFIMAVKSFMIQAPGIICTSKRNFRVNSLCRPLYGKGE